MEEKFSSADLLNISDKPLPVVDSLDRGIDDEYDKNAYKLGTKDLVNSYKSYLVNIRKGHTAKSQCLKYRNNNDRQMTKLRLQ
jgi:hypothetical protein